MTYNKQYCNYLNCLDLYYAMCSRSLSLTFLLLMLLLLWISFFILVLVAFSYYSGELKWFDLFICIRLWIDAKSNLHELCTLMLKWLFDRLSRLDQICKFPRFRKKYINKRKRRNWMAHLSPKLGAGCLIGIYWIFFFCFNRAMEIWNAKSHMFVGTRNIYIVRNDHSSLAEFHWCLILVAVTKWQLTTILLQPT